MDKLGVHLSEGVLIGLAVLAALLVVGGVWLEVRAYLRHRESAPERRERIAYRGTGKSYGDLSEAEFRFKEGGLDVGVHLEDEADVDASRARFDSEQQRREASDVEDDELA